MEYGILHADAHMDLRDTFEGFKYSHASIFFNTLKFNNVKKLVQVGIRDYCHQEKALAESQPERVKVFFDRDNRRRMYEGATWKTIVDEMVAALPQRPTFQSTSMPSTRNSARTPALRFLAAWNMKN